MLLLALYKRRLLGHEIKKGLRPNEVGFRKDLSLYLKMDMEQATKVAKEMIRRGQSAFIKRPDIEEIPLDLLKGDLKPLALNQDKGIKDRAIPHGA